MNIPKFLVIADCIHRHSGLMTLKWPGGIPIASQRTSNFTGWPVHTKTWKLTGRLFSDSLNSKGYVFDWNIYHEGHSWGLWRATCDEMLTFFFPKGSVPLRVNAIKQNNYALGQNYPNPFSGSTTIPVTVDRTRHVYAHTIFFKRKADTGGF